MEIDGATHSTDAEIASDSRDKQIYENVDGALEEILRVLGDDAGGG